MQTGRIVVLMWHLCANSWYAGSGCMLHSLQCSAAAAVRSGVSLQAAFAYLCSLEQNMLKEMSCTIVGIGLETAA